MNNILEEYSKLIEEEKDLFKEKFNDKEKEDIKSVVDNAERVLVISTDKASALCGTRISIVSAIVMMFRNALKDGILDSKDLERIVKYSLMKEKEVLKKC